MTRHSKVAAVVILLSGAAVTAATESTPTSARRPELLEEVVVVAPYGVALARDRVPANAQSATAQQIERSQALDLTDFLNRNFASVSINHAQNNPLQPDFNVRGFTASPLLGLPQGLAVYQNGVRVNEPFGDTVNWDLVPLSAVSAVQLLPGSSPVFGLNTLGGALSLQMKNGFNYQGTDAEVYGGSFARRSASAQHGGNNGRWGYYANVDYFEEDGWRDYSQSDALRFFGALNLHGASSSLDLSIAHVESELRGNGASPAELLAIDRTQVFTHPDLTENTLTQLTLEGAVDISDHLRIAGNTFYRDLDTDTFNGDGTIFEECEFGGAEFLVEEDFQDLNGDDACSAEDDAQVELVLDPNGGPIEAEIDGAQLDAINNIGRREQKNYGASLQLVLNSELGADRQNDLILGTAYSRGDTSFNSSVEVAQLLENRATSRTGIFADEFRTNVGSELTTWSLYFADTLDVSEKMAVTLAGRYDNTRIQLSDRSGQSPELDARHEFDRFNPAAGLTLRVAPGAVLYASYAESTRAPTPVELACASEDAPCNLPNAFLADPPLDEVVASSVELGIRGTSGRALRWHLGAFRTVNDNDILFQTTGGAQANVGFFDNVGDTRRAGIEFSLSQRLTRLSWFFEYSLIEATFEDSFIVNSPNHPLFDDDEASSPIVGDGKLLVASGSTIPGIPRHQANVGLDFACNDRLSVGTDLSFRSGVYLRGDEVNALDRTDSYSVVNLRGEYHLSKAVVVFARLENVFDEAYESFGLLGEPGEVFEDFQDPRFLGAGPPFGAWLGIRVRL